MSSFLGAPTPTATGDEGVGEKAVFGLRVAIRDPSEQDAEHEHGEADHEQDAHERQDELDVLVEADLGECEAGDEDRVSRQDKPQPAAGYGPGRNHERSGYRPRRAGTRPRG